MANRLAGAAATVKLTYIVSHPIQYQAPLLQRIAAQTDITLRVVFERGASAGPRFDPGFQREIRWDVPLTQGYDHVDLADTDLDSEIRAAEILWLHGWQSRTLRRAIDHAHRSQKPVLMRGENCAIAMPDGRGLRRVAKRAYLNTIFQRCSALSPTAVSAPSSATMRAR